MKKTLTSLTVLLVALTALAATNPIAYRIEQGIYREKATRTNGLVLLDLYQRMYNDGRLYESRMEAGIYGVYTQHLRFTVAQASEPYHNSFQNVASTNTYYYTNGTVSNVVSTMWVEPNEFIHFLGNGDVGRNVFTNGDTVVEIVNSVTFRVWVEHQNAIVAQCTNNTLPDSIQAFGYMGKINTGQNQFFVNGYADVGPFRTNRDFTTPPVMKMVKLVTPACPFNEMLSFQGRYECWYCPEDGTNCFPWTKPGEIMGEGDYPFTNIIRHLRPSLTPSGFNGTFNTQLDGGLYTNTAHLFRTQDFIDYTYLGPLTPTNGVFTWHDSQAPTNHAFYHLSPTNSY